MILPDSQIDDLISRRGSILGGGVWHGNPRALARSVEALVLESLPRVLIPLPPNSPTSTERALKQVLQLLEGIEGVEDWVQASIDDITVMLKCIK